MRQYWFWSTLFKRERKRLGGNVREKTNWWGFFIPGSRTKLTVSLDSILFFVFVFLSLLFIWTNYHPNLDGVPVKCANPATRWCEVTVRATPTGSYWQEGDACREEIVTVPSLQWEILHFCCSNNDFQPPQRRSGSCVKRKYVSYFISNSYAEEKANFKISPWQ